MINQTPSDLGKFPVPPSGHPIPRGWFGRLVRFINSLILHGDGQYLTVKHTLDGQTITPTPALLQALGNGGAPPAAGGGADGIEAAVTGGTASITLTGGTGSVNITGTGAVTITKNTNTGDIEINATGGTAGSVGFPDYVHPLIQSGNVAFNTLYPGSAYADQNIWLIGRITMVADQNQQLAGSLIIHLTNGANTETIWLADTLLNNMDGQEDIPIMLPIPSGFTFTLDYNNPPDSISLGIYPCL